MDEKVEKSALTARILLMTGGVFGFHRLYLNQIPEAFIFMSTAGVFLLGLFYDSFFMHNLVEEYNRRLEIDEDQEKKKFRNGRALPRTSKMVMSSIAQIVRSIAYGMWLGFLTWAGGSVTFGKTMQDSVLMITAIAAAVSAGIYIIGNCEGESRDLLYIWIATFSAAFITGKALSGSCLRALLVSAIAGSVIGNRTARIRSPQHRPFNWKHYLFWTSLFACLLCVITVGATRHVLHRKVASSKPGESSVVSSVGSLVYDRFYKPDRIISFFKDSPKIEYIKPATKSREKNSDSWMDFDLIVRAPQWSDHLTMFVVNLLRAETRATEGNLKEEPLKWAMWRVYLVLYFDLPPFVTDNQLDRSCNKWNKDNEAKRKESTGKEYEDYSNGYAFRAVKRGCAVTTQ